MNTLLNWLRGLWGRLERQHKLITVEGDTPPQTVRAKRIYLAHEDGTDWAVAMLCPCGCGDRLELMLLTEVRPSWRLLVDEKGLPSLKPSVWREKGCGSHFWLKAGRIVWCD
jgi:hypothetical protein